MANQQNILSVGKLDLAELNRVLREIQQRVIDLQNLPVEFVSTVQVDEELKLKEREQQDDVDLSEEGKVWFQPREGQAPEPQFQVTESTVDADGNTIRRRLDVVQRAAEDGVDVGKASTFNATDGITATLDLDNDRVDLGLNDIEVNSVTFDTTPTDVPDTPGTLFWDETDKTLAVHLNDDVTLQIGQEEHVLALNHNLAYTLENGRVVKCTGTQGNRVTADYANYAVEDDHHHKLGVVTEDIETNTQGYVTTRGIIRGLNTNAFNEGDILYLTGTAGQISSSPPAKPYHVTCIGLVLKKDGGNGMIYVDPRTFENLEELNDVEISSPQETKDTLIWDATPGVWKNAEVFQRKHGFELGTDGAPLQSLTYDKTTKKITLTPTGSVFEFWIDGVKFTKTGAQVSGAHSLTTGMKYFYYDSAGVLQTSDSVWSIRDRTVTPVAAVYWNNTLSDGVCFYECHTADRQLEIHFNLHFSRGCQYVSGYDLTGYTPATDTDAGVTYAIGTGVIADEDIRFASSAVPDGGPYIVFYRTGAAGEWQWASYNFPFAYGATYPQWNEWTGATWQLTEVTGGSGTVPKYMNYYICATSAVTPQAAQAFLIPGQAQYTSLTAAQAESLQSLSLGTLPFEEVAPLYRVTLAVRQSYGGTYNVLIQQVTSLKNQTVTVTGGSVGITDHGALTGLADDDHTQYLDTTRHAAIDAADHTSGAATDGYVLTADGAGGAAWEAATTGVTDHGALTGLADDDHTQYALVAGDTFTGDVAFESATSAKPYITIKNTNADADGGYLDFLKYSASPADADTIGSLRFLGYDDGSNVTPFAALYGIALDVTGGTEDGVVDLYTQDAGTFQINTRFGQGQTEFYRPIVLNSYLVPGTTFGGFPAPSVYNIGGNFPAGPAPWYQRIRRWDVGAPGSTAYSANSGGSTLTGAITVNSAATGFDELAMFLHATITTSTTDNNGVGCYNANPEFDMGDVTGGFVFATRFAFPSTGGLKSDGKYFLGIHSGTSAITGTTEPSALTNMAGLGKDEADTNFQFMHNDGSGTATKVDLGVAYNGFSTRFWYELIMYVPRGGGSVSYRILKMTDQSVVASGSVTTNLPAAATLYGPRIYHANGAGGTTQRCDFGFVHMEARS